MKFWNSFPGLRGKGAVLETHLGQFFNCRVQETAGNTGNTGMMIKGVLEGLVLLLRILVLGTALEF